MILYFGLCFLAIINIIIGLNKKSNKPLFLILFIAMVIIFIIGKNNPDYNTYLYYFNNVNNTPFLNMEYGYYLINVLFNLLGLSFDILRITILIISITLISRSISKLNININIFIGVYFLLSFFLDLVQLRHLLAFAIISYSLPYLLSNKERKFIFFVIIAAQFHVISYFLVPFVFFTSRKTLKFINIIALLSVFISIFIFVFNIDLSFVSRFFDIIGFEKISNYLSTRTNYGHLLYWFALIVNLIVYLFSSNYIRKSLNNVKLQTLIRSIAYYFISFFPVFLFNSNFTRLLRLPLLFSIYIFSYLTTTIKVKYRVIIITVYFVWIFIMYYILMYSEVKNIVYPILDNIF